MKRTGQNTSDVDSQLVELAGRNWLVSQMIQGGIEIARPERDHGIDLIAYLEKPYFIACPVQLKVSSESGFVVHREKYMGMLLVNVWNIEDSSQTVAFATTSSEALHIAEEMEWHTTDSWNRKNGYYRVPSVKTDSKLEKLLGKYKMTPNTWETVIRHAVDRTPSPNAL